MSFFRSPFKDDNGVGHFPLDMRLCFFVPTGQEVQIGNTLNTFAGLINDVTEDQNLEMSLYNVTR